MTEWRLYPEGTVPHVSTAEFHHDRERAPHVDQPLHRPRLDKAAEFVDQFAQSDRGMTVVVDLGCGDGGLLQLLDQRLGRYVDLHGYDFQPSNAAGWAERNVDAQALNFVDDWDKVEQADLYVMTEVLEHCADPHLMVRRVADRGSALVASSPWTEHAGSHDACHAWAWDVDGYRALMEQGGFRVVRHEQVGMFQAILAEVNR